MKRQIRQRSLRKRSRDTLPYRLILPAAIAMLLIHFLPTVIGVVMSFTDFSSSALREWSKAEFVGLDNYADILFGNPIQTEKFLQSALASLVYAVCSIVGIYLVGLLAALLLNGKEKWLKPLRGIFLISWVVPSVVSVFIWTSIFSYDYGPLNYLLVKFGITEEKVYWLIGDLAWLPPIVANIWKAWPFAFISLLAGLQSIPDSLYESAQVDGAGVFSSFRNITMPSLYPVSRVIIMLLIVWTALDFNTTYVMYNYSPPTSANVLPVYIYNVSFRSWKFGSGAAMSTLLMLVMAVVCLIYLRVCVDNEKQ